MDIADKGEADEPVRVQVPGQASAQLISASGGAAADGRGQLGWALFEWARNPYVILITIYIFSPYFSSTVVGDPVRGQAIWREWKVRLRPAPPTRGRTWRAP